MALGAAAVVACWLSSGAAPLTDAIQGARVPADFIRDYVTARARLDGGPGPPPAGESANDLGQRLGAPRVLLLGGPYYLHPPPALLAVMPIAWLPFPAAARVWAVASLAALVWLAVSLLGILAPGRPRGAARLGVAALVAVALALWPPSLHCLEKGQWSIVVAALLAAGYRALERGRPARAGVLLAGAAALKATPVVLVAMLAARSRRAAAAMLAALVAVGLLALVVNGLPLWRAFVVDAPHDAAVWATWLANTASPAGVYARLLESGPFSRPLVAAPLASHAAFAITALGLLVAAAIAAPRARPAPAGPPDAAGGRAMACWSAAWLVLPVLLNPLGWTHVVLILSPSLAVAFREGGRATRIGATLVLAALSIPRQRLMAWAGPMPVAPGRGLVLGAHAAAAIALYAMLLRESVRARSGGGRTPLTPG